MLKTSLGSYMVNQESKISINNAFNLKNYNISMKILYLESSQIAMGGRGLV